MTIYIAADHGGYKMKEMLKTYLLGKGERVEDMGPEAFNPADDYPDFSLSVAQAVAQDHGSLGILLCRSGQGVCIVANKVKGIRTTMAWNKEVAAEGRRDNHANILCFVSDFLSEEETKQIADAWLNEKPATEERHVRRVKKIEAIENNQ